MRIDRKTPFEFLPNVLTISEVASCIPLPVSTVYDLVRRGEVASVRAGRRILIPKTSVVKLLTPVGADVARQGTR